MHRISLKRLVLLVLFSTLGCIALSGQEQVDITIRFFDKKLYYPGDPVELKLEISNHTPETFYFNLADDRSFNVDFEVRTMTNRLLSQSDELTIVRRSNQHIFFREISLAPGEQFSFFVDLTDFIEITEPGAYILQANFFPELIKPGIRSRGIASNRLNLSVRPDRPDMAMEIYEDTVQMTRLQKQKLPPDEVVTWTIRSRQQGDWDKFFLYLNIENLLMKNASRKRQYLLMNQEEQRMTLAEYQDDLMNERTDGDIVLIPEMFEIIKTEYTPEEATVKVEEKFRYSGYREVKEYTYYLRKRDNVWFIYDYEVRNVGTE